MYTQERDHLFVRNVVKDFMILLRFLRRHLRTHLGRKPAICNECGKSFTSKTVLAIHSRRHTGERPFSYKECGKRHFFRHSRIHADEWPFSCKEFRKRFREQGNLLDTCAYTQGNNHILVMSVEGVLA